MRIYLTGYMGCGKTSIGQQLAKKADFAFLDLDKVFEEQYHVSVMDFFLKYDEQAFRKIEHELLLQTKSKDNIVIATGGGTPCFFNNMDFMNESGITVYLKLHPFSLFRRLTESKKARPLIAELNGNDLLLRIESQLSYREKFYLKSKIIIKGENINIQTLLTVIQKHPEWNKIRS